ncbi:MAG: tetratricopeptide repeat protein [Planctomycetes bacterium]|nr:tetratricopeptide repeat protein [Planctomycetota bacterium]
MTRLSLAMIVRDEAERLPSLLAVLGPLEESGVIDEIVAVDTGSRDGTPELLRAHGATVVDAEWEHDFSAARNRALDVVGGDWVLVLDADEAIDSKDVVRLRALAEVAPSEVGGLVLDVRNYTSDMTHLDWCPIEGDEREQVGHAGYVPTQVVRLFRRDPRIRYRGRVHELVELAIADAGLEIRPAGVVLRHVLSRQTEKRRLYLDLLRRKVIDDPLSAKAHWELAQALLDEGELEGAFSAYRTAWQIARGNVEVGLHYAMALNRVGRHREALGIIRAIRGDGPRDPRVEFQMGVALARLGETSMALTALYSAHLAGARSPQTYYWLALLTAQESPQAGLEVVETLLASVPEFWPGRLLRSRLAIECGDARVAKEDLRIAIELAGDTPEFLAEFGTYLGQLGAHPDYLRDLLDELRHDATKAVRVARALLAVSDAEGAAGFLGTVRGLDDQRPIDLVRAIALMRADRHEEAKAALMPLAEDAQFGVEALFALSQSQTATGELAAAASSLERLLARDPEHVRALVDLAGLHGNSGRVDVAEQLLERAAALDPNDPLIEHNRAVAALLRHPADPERAALHRRRALALGHPDDPRLAEAIESQRAT